MSKKRQESDAVEEDSLVQETEEEDEDVSEYELSELYKEKDDGETEFINPCLPLWVPRWLHDCEHDSFNMMVGLVIVTNAVIIGVETDLGQPHFMFFEHFFCIFFIVEMTLRHHKGCLQTGSFKGGVCKYWSQGSNAFDGTLVVTGTLDLYILPLIIHGKKGGAVSTLRLLRMLRVMRILRLFKVFRELTVILQAFLKAFSCVMWVSVLTVIMDYVCAVFLTKVVGHHAADFGENEVHILTWWGSIGNSMRTLFIMQTLAEFDVIMLVMQEHMNPLFVMAFMVFYVMVAGFTMVSLITGILCESLVAAQQDDEAFKIAQTEDDQKAFESELQGHLESIDANKDGYLKRSKLDKVFFKDKKFLIKLASVGIDVTKDEVMRVVDKIHDQSMEKQRAALQDGSARDKTTVDKGVEIKAIVSAMSEMKGVGKATVIEEIRHSVRTMQKENTEMQQMLEKLQQNLNAKLGVR